METPKHILLVDDEPDFLFSAGFALRRAGYKVEIAENGKEALDKILEARNAREPFDLLVTDIRMPWMSGFELMDTMKLWGIRTPLIAMTCFDDGDLVGELKSRGCEVLIEKPFSPEHLVSRIGHFLIRCAVSPVPGSAA
jgi:CheY-like chemotaxis protein